MTNDEEIISNISYTASDFRSIYPQLLDTAKSLTNNWDPSLSNESDPGNVLIKEAAIVGDKVNYHVDKNVLECFPLSATQQSSARQIYDLVGYNMHWYQSALGNATFRLLKTPANIDSSLSSITIDAGTIICDNSGEYVYTLLQPTNKMTAINTIYTAPVIQGTITKYEINGETTITIDNLDENLRIYFPTNVIAQNGIYVYNTNGNPTSLGFDNTTLDPQSASWKLVDNLAKYPSGSKVFKFGLDLNSDNCYIEFPEDILSSNLIGAGINIYYTTTLGALGNIKDGILNKFLSDYNVQVSDDTGMMPVNDYIVVSNTAISGGTDPESLQDAYRNYKKLIGTYETLVTRRDYENAIYKLDNSENTNKLVSNDFVTDRTSDINYTQKIIETNLASDYARNYVIQSNNEDIMKPYDISLYLFRKPSSMLTTDDYDLSFTPNQDKTTKISIEDDLDELKSVQHNIYYIRDIGNLSDAEKDELYFNINNLCRLNGTLTTYYKVTDEEAKEIQNKVILQLITTYNSREIDFGNELDYNELISTIKNADDRIRNVSLVAPVYEPEMQFTDLHTLSLYQTETNQDVTNINNETIAKMILSGKVQLFTFEEEFQYDFGQINGQKVSNIETLSTENEIVIEHVAPTIAFNKVVYTYDNDTTTFAEVQIGTTYDSSETYYSSQSLTSEITPQDITNYTIVSVPSPATAIEDATPLNKNDIIQVVSPNLIPTATYQATVRYSANFTCPANTPYVLQEGDLLKCIYVDSATGTWATPKVYKKGTIIETTGFTLIVTPNIEDTSEWEGSTVSTTVITASATLKILEVSKILVNSDTPYYVISNKIDNDYYTLELSKDSDTILKENEYLLYTNSSLDGVVILGSGTTLRLATSASNQTVTLTSKVIDISEVFSTEVGEAKDVWGTLPDDILAQENEIISLSEGDKIKVISDTNITCSNNLTPLTTQQYGFIYKLAGNDTVEQVVFPDNVSHETFPIRYNSNMILSGNAIVPQLLVGTQKIITSVGTFEAGKSILYNYPLNISGGNNINVQILNTTTGKYESLLSLYAFTQDTLTNIQTGGPTRSAYNKLLNISAKDGVDTLVFTFNPRGTYGYYLLPTSFTIPNGGVVKLGVDAGRRIGTFLDVYNENAISTFTQTESKNLVLAIDADATAFNNLSLAMGYTCTSDNNTYTINVNGENIVFTQSGSTLQCQDGAGVTYTYTKSSTNVYTRIDDDNNTCTITIDGVYLYILDKELSTAINNYISVSFGYMQKILGLNSKEINTKNIAGNYFSYSIEDEYPNVISKISNILARLSISANFNWAYKVPADNKVLQPLAGESYFNPNHIYNSYTLAKILFSESNIIVNPSSIK